MANKDLQWCRVSPVVGTWGDWWMGEYKLHVHIKIFTPMWRPNYALGRHLVIETDKCIYRVYNPQRLKFDLDRLIWGAKNYLTTVGETYIEHRLEDSYKGK